MPAPVFFHGPGEKNDIWQKTVSTEIHSEERSVFFIGVYVQGTVQPDGKSGWNAWSTTTETEPDDTGFVLAIVKTFRKAFQWNGRLYAHGVSTGASLCMRIGVNGALGFVGIAPSGALLLSKPERGGSGVHNYNFPSDPACTVPIAYIGFHGSDDEVVPNVCKAGCSPDGVAAPPGGNPDMIAFMSAADSHEAWAKMNGCFIPPSMTKVVATAKTGVTKADVSKWRECIHTAPMEHYEVENAGHEVADTIRGKSIALLAIDFFERVEEKCQKTTCPTTRASLPSSCINKVQPQAATANAHSRTIFCSLLSPSLSIAVLVLLHIFFSSREEA